MTNFSNKDSQPFSSILEEGNPLMYSEPGSFVAWFKDPEHTILHREDGPAMLFDNGIERWYVDGKLHREDGPAVITNFSEEWWLDGNRHRVDGPAIKDKECSEWYVDGKRHRLDGPAIKDKEHSEWYVDGKRHRVDGPAIEYVDAYVEVEYNGAIYRAEGPGNEWWLFGEQVTENEVQQFKEILFSHLKIEDLLAMPLSIVQELYMANKNYAYFKEQMRL